MFYRFKKISFLNKKLSVLFTVKDLSEIINFDIKSTNKKIIANK